MSKRLFSFAFLILSGIYTSYAQISLVSFSTGYTSPVDIKNCGDDRLFIVEQRGTIQICDTDGVKNAQPFLNITGRVLNSGEQGLLGLAFPPDFLSSGYFYVNYVTNADGHTRISRFHVDNSLTPDSADPASEEILLSIYQPYSNHKGGHLAFGPDGYLYIGMGDGGSGGDPQNRAQNIDSLLGKMLRIEVDPSIPDYAFPPTNPFYNSTQGRKEIWAIGLRNPWRWSFDRLTGDLWIGDVGQNLIEEVDFQPAGAPGGLNYGWRCYEADAIYNTSGTCPSYSQTVAPVFQYNHSPGGYCSITGGYIYRGFRFQELYGKYFFLDYCNSQMRYLEANDSGGFTHTNLGNIGGANITSFGEDKNGELYCSGSSTIYHLISQNCAPVATINAGKDTIDDCGTGLAQLSVPAGPGYTYTWIHNGTDTVSTSASFVAGQSGEYVVTVDNQGCTSTDTVHVISSPNLNLNFSGLDTLYCVYHAPVNLLPNYLGGFFTGAGITGATFNPTVAGVGTHTITYTYQNASGCTYQYSSDVRIDACVNVPGNKWTNTIRVYPNPSEGNFRVGLTIDSHREFTMNIQDVTGRSLYTETFSLAPGEYSIPIRQSLAKGIYMLSISDHSSSASYQLTIQ